MALTPRLELRQSQSLVMTPQLQQAIKLLQMSQIELTGFIEAELEQNPFLERKEGEQEAPAPTVDQNDAVSTFEKAQDAIDAEQSDVDPEAGPNERMAASASTQDWGSGSGGGSGGGEDGLSAIDLARAQISLSDHLDAQIALMGLSANDTFIARHMVGHLDAAGYLATPLSEIAEAMAVTEQSLEDLVLRLQGLEPYGVFARSLQECLAIQLKEKNRLDPAMQAFIDNLELIAKRDFQKLERICGVSLEDVSDMLDEIRALNPKPGILYGEPTQQPPEPDILITQDSHGAWLIELNPSTLPRLIVNENYYATVSKTARQKDEKEFMSERFNDANWLVRTLDQRARTILAVAKEIVRQQDGFLTYGVRYLRPLNLKTVAEAIEMHESTVSRVTTNKTLSCPRGVFDLKYFFTASIASSSGGDAHSAEAVRDRIKELIERETPEDILSDEALVAILQKDGIDIARRTVAKYRESLGILSSAKRRREKKLSAARD